ncbi:hypothetical protein GQ55_8G174500 [Panicum hallii var. hallii]|uniref:Uncharacterized protein n=1 Tax=Panicum hallii var. hallii TaxID=1504633 RepID=A0A2T7CNM5_9POAL|nr:hypothetical protein GQ55_8G174500 [Panicum hallii var. hallii]
MTRQRPHNPRAAKQYVHNFCRGFSAKTANAAQPPQARTRFHTAQPSPKPPTFLLAHTLSRPIRPLPLPPPATAGSPTAGEPPSLRPPPRPQDLVVLVRAFLRCSAAGNPSSSARLTVGRAGVGGSGCRRGEDGSDSVADLVCPDMLVGPGVGSRGSSVLVTPVHQLVGHRLSFVGVDVPKIF